LSKNYFLSAILEGKRDYLLEYSRVDERSYVLSIRIIIYLACKKSKSRV